MEELSTYIEIGPYWRTGLENVNTAIEQAFEYLYSESPVWYGKRVQISRLTFDGAEML